MNPDQSPNIILNLLFENEHAIIIDKPAMVLSVPSRMGSEEQRPVAGLLLQAQLNQQIYPVHRLDYEVSGLMMFAKTPEFHKVANQWFEHQTAQKTYEALTEFKIRPEFGLNTQQIWQHKIVRGKKRSFFAEHGKASITWATWIGELTVTGDTCLQWQLQPRTGRPHQLRLELAHHGYIICGDSLYGAQKELNRAGIALRAVALDLSHCKQVRQFGLPEKITTGPLLEWMQRLQR